MISRMMISTAMTAIMMWLVGGTVPASGERTPQPEVAKRSQTGRIGSSSPNMKAGEGTGQHVHRAVEQTGKVSKPPRMPVYKPPLRGAPGHRVGGGTRGSQHELPMIAALAPDDHIGRTFHPTPMLYWYLSQLTDRPLILTINERDRYEPLIEVELPPPSREGIQRVDLNRFGIALEPGKAYQWLVSLVVDPQRPSSDVITGGWIELSELPQSLAGQLEAMDPADATRVFAEAGFWYDAVDAVSHGIEARRGSGELQSMRAALLSQIGLADIEP